MRAALSGETIGVLIVSGTGGQSRTARTGPQENVVF